MAEQQTCGLCLRFHDYNIENKGKCRLGFEVSKSDPACERFVDKIKIERKGDRWILVAGNEQLEFASFNEIDSVQVGEQLLVEPKEVLKAIAQVPERLVQEEELREVKVSELRAQNIGKPVIMNTQIAGEQSQKAVPRTISFACKKCDLMKTICFDHLNNGEKDFFLETVVFGDSLKTLAHNIRGELQSGEGPTACKGSHPLVTTVQDYMDFTILFVRDLLDPLKKFEQRVYETRKIYLVNQTVPYAKKIAVKGKVFLEPKSRNITVIADYCEPYEDEVTNFEVSESDKMAWNKHFAGNDLKRLLNQVAPGMVGRPLVQEATLVLLHSVSKIPDIYGSPIRGSLRIMFIGDTKTYKSRLAQDLTIDYYGFGDYILAESSSRTGITYTIDSDNKALIWGALPLNDLGFLVIDGMQSLYKEEWRQTREALESQRVVVRRFVSGEALARTRILGIINPGQRDQKPMSTYVFKCQALTDTYPLADPADVTRWDAVLPFSRYDVEAEKVTKAKPAERPIPDEVFIRHVFWVWSRRAEHIEYSEEAKNAIIEEARRFIAQYAVDSIPIVHLGFRDVITRFAVAFACLRHSVDPTHTKVLVKKEHVEEASAFLHKVAQGLDLEAYKLEEEGQLTIGNTEMQQIIAELDEIALGILNEIIVRSKTSVILAEKLGVSVETIKRRYATLGKYGLIRTIPGKGVTLSVKGATFLRGHLVSVKVPKTDTNRVEQVSITATLTPTTPTPTLTQENFEKVVNAIKTIEDRSVYATLPELAFSSGMPQSDLKEILKVMEKEGRVFQYKEGAWKLAK